jgi:hypothetical protein
MARKNADWAKARALCPPEQYGSEEWLEHYAANPDALTQMLGDLFRVYKSEEEKAKGNANPSGGRRKSYINGNMEELWAIITPRFATTPFHESFRDLLGTRSQRAFAMKAGIDHRELSRWLKDSAGTLKGRRCPPSRWDLEALAKAGGVHPAYFVEWRVMVVQDLITEVFTTQPNLSISVLRSLRP